MCLEDVGGVAFPEYLAPFLDDILREIPAVTVPVHAHLRTPLALVSTCTATKILTAWIRRITRPHSGQAVSPRRSLSSCLVTCQQHETHSDIYAVYAQLQMRHQVLGHSEISP